MIFGSVVFAIVYLLVVTIFVAFGVITSFGQQDQSELMLSLVGILGFMLMGGFIDLWVGQKEAKEKALENAGDLKHYLDRFVFVTEKRPAQLVNKRLSWLAQKWHEAEGELLALDLQVHEGRSGWTAEATSARQAKMESVEHLKKAFEKDYDVAMRIHGENAKLLLRDIKYYLPKVEEQKAS